jgi:D-alanine-D-alanine ligase
MGSGHRIRLGIIFGGKSGEHEVSIASAASVIAALDPREFEITAIGIKKSGELASATEVRRMLPETVKDRMNPYGAIAGGDSRVRLSSSGESVDSGPTPEIIFPLLHGPFGEDGTIQGLLEIAGLPYIGCGVLASAVGMDKEFMKKLFAQAGLPVLPYLVCSRREVFSEFDAIKTAVDAKLGYPVFSKPVSLGSSVGVCKIHSAGELEAALHTSIEFDRKIVIEKGIEAREAECGVLGNENPEVSIVGEIIPSREFYDYEAKYLDPSTRLEIPARLEEKQVLEIRNYAVRAFQAIDGAGLARVDFFVERPTGAVWINEINTMPGFTPISMYSKVWAASGVGFEDLVRRLIRLGLQRHQERREMRVSPL